MSEDLKTELKRLDNERAWIRWAQNSGRFPALLYVASRIFIGNIWRRIRRAPW